VHTKQQHDRLLNLARTVIELGDVTWTSETATAYIFALCHLTNKTPQKLVEDLFKSLPGDEEWEENFLPLILEYPDDYEPLT